MPLIERRQLLAHELAHTVQQSEAGPISAINLDLSSPTNPIEAEAQHAAEAVLDGRPHPGLSRTQKQIARDTPHSDTPDAVDKSPVVLIRINLAGRRVIFVTAAKNEYTGTVDTDLEPGSYKLTPRTQQKMWVITPSRPGLRFFVDLENADPWALSYSPGLRLEVTPGSEADRPIGEKLDIEDTLDIQGDPKVNANYVQNAFQGVGIFGWGGPFRLDHKIVNGQGLDSVLIPRAEFTLDTDPLKDAAIAINKVYKTRAGAEAAAKAFGVPGAYAYYIGPGGHIYPTIISDTTAPALCQSLRKAIEVERTDAKAAENLSVQLLLWYVGARFPAKASEPPVSGPSVKSPPPAPQAAAGGGSDRRHRRQGGIYYRRAWCGRPKSLN